MAADDPELFSSWRQTGYEGGTGMRVGRIRRQCKQLIKELGLPASTDLPGLCDLVARRVGRPVHLVPMSLGGVVSGMTASTDEDYWIFYELRTSPWHQIHIVLHEIGHLLLGHEQDPAVTEDALRMWTPSVDVTTAMRRLGMTPDFARHHCYDNLTERETEVLGTLLMEHVVPTSPDHGLPLQGRAAELAAALGPALRHVRTDRADHAHRADRTGGADGGVRGEPGGDTGV
ncbi:ImmA/IrrE family metallo-endopeptidase [Streptomyces antimycoticus]|uniref:ImmA/IrrE family metallo-endopeptidase n=1 Tax=Streptomyces antimycoticus TaxID=68175 RepID=UPI0036A1E17A